MTTPFATSVSVADVLRWEEECAQIDVQIADLVTKREKFAQMISLAKEFASSSPEPQEEKEENGETADEGERATVPQLKHGGGRRREETWIQAVEVIVKAHPEGIAYDEIKKLVPVKLKEQLERFPAAKGLYTALRKLESNKVIVRHNAMAFTRKGYAKYKARVAAGEIAPTSGPKRESPIADAIIEFLRENGPSKGAAIRAHLIKFPDFGPPVLRNSSAMYNVLKRLVDREELQHDEEAATYSIAQENGAPASASAPEAGRAATLPFENVVGFPQSR